MKEGKLVPSELTVGLIQKAISESDNDKFLIDGFPRNEENLTAFENLVSLSVDLIVL
jgi:UMP-CMP kinase